MASIIASAIHDFQHPGLSNDFLIQESNDLAVTYNDQSVLENHHVAAAFKLLGNPELNFLDSLSLEEQKEFRRITISMVLATDLSRHKENLDKFKTRADYIKRMLRDGTKPHGHMPRELSHNSGYSSSLGEVTTDNLVEDRLMLLKMALKASDLGHAMKPIDQHMWWSQRVKEEFFLEGDKAKGRGMNVKPLFDRTRNTNLGKSQAGFLKFLVMPLYNELIPLLRLEEPVLAQLNSNLDFWNVEAERIERERIGMEAGGDGKAAPKPKPKAAESKEDAPKPNPKPNAPKSKPLDRNRSQMPAISEMKTVNITSGNSSSNNNKISSSNNKMTYGENNSNADASEVKIEIGEGN